MPKQSRRPGRPLRVCYFGTWRPRYSRNLIMIQCLREQGIEVHECHATLWRGIEDRVEVATGGWFHPGFIGRLIRATLLLVRRYRAAPPHDVVVVGYPGQLDVFLATLLATLRGVPVVWDVFMSAYLVAGERKLHERSPFSASVLKAVECVALRVPRRLIQDTAQYVAWFHRVHRTPKHRFRLVPTGADDRVYRPGEAPPGSTGDPKTILYYGTYIPNHGVPYIIEAAAALAPDGDTRFVMIGDGPERPAAERAAKERGLENVTFLDWMSREELVAAVHGADICLGTFGETPQSVMTVLNKFYECLAMRKPVITGDSAAIRSRFVPREHLVVCPRRDGPGLAGTIRALLDDPSLRRRIADAGHAEFVARYSLRPLGATFLEILEGVSRRRRKERPV